MQILQSDWLRVTRQGRVFRRKRMLIPRFLKSFEEILLAEKVQPFWFFFTTNRIWSDSLPVEEPIKLHNSTYIPCLSIYIYITSKQKFDLLHKNFIHDKFVSYGKRSLPHSSGECYVWCYFSKT